MKPLSSTTTTPTTSRSLCPTSVGTRSRPTRLTTHFSEQYQKIGMTMTIDGQKVFAVEGYEYNIQYRFLEPGIWDRDTTEWHYSYTNKFSGQNWYPSSKAVKNALAQLKATRYGYSR